jgi:LAO/AO transport system kinase
MREVDVADLVSRATDGSPRAVARLISLVEDASPLLREVTAALTPLAGTARVIGLTGSPGVGKSTTTSALVAAYRARGMRVGVLAVDPSSPFSGGALLGDRVRMQEHATDPEVFIRSMASRGHLGGLAWATPQAIRVLDAAGCDVIFVETVGVGQAEVAVASLADSTIVLVAPGMGDSIQAAKAGILEVADIFVVNKADRDGAQQAVRDLRMMVALAERGPDEWKPPIVSAVASKNEGIDEIAEALDKHHARLAAGDDLHRRRLARARDEIEAIAVTALRERMGDPHGDRRLDALAEEVLSGARDPYAAADELVAAVVAATDGAPAPPGH